MFCIVYQYIPILIAFWIICWIYWPGFNMICWLYFSGKWSYIYKHVYIQNKNILLFQCTLKFVKWIYVYSLELETFQYIRAPVPIFMLKLELFKFLNSHFSSCFLPGASHAMRQQVLIDNFDTREEFVRSQGIAFASIAILGLMVTPLAGYKSYLLLNPLWYTAIISDIIPLVHFNFYIHYGDVTWAALAS